MTISMGIDDSELDWEDDSVICDECGRPFHRASDRSCLRKNEHITPDLADLIVNDIEYELTGRKGIGNEFEACDSDIKQEMRNAWTNIVRQHVNGSENK